MFSAGDIAFIIICTILVFFMTPGLSLFYAGMVRRKNTVNTIMSTFFCCGLAIVMWFVMGYSLSFGSDAGGLGIIGNLENAFFNGVSAFEAGPYADNIPGALYALFQLMFCVITPAIIVGSVSGRMRFPAVFVFVALWLLLVYYPLAHMVWGDNGLIQNFGAIDFAGGNVIHISSGVSGLVACILVGARKGYGVKEYHPHSVPLFFIGAAILWAGWFAFNGGCALGANELAVQAIGNTAIASAAAMLSWMLIEVLLYRKVTLMGSATGAIVGLVAITPGAGYVPFWSAIIIGALVSPICYLAITKIKRKLGYDDAVDAFGCHGVGGIWGGIATGIFASPAINEAVQWNGLVFGDYHQLLAQLGAIGISVAYAAVVTAAIIVVLKQVMRVRATEEEEALGMDISEHSEQAYPAFSGIDQ